MFLCKIENYVLRVLGRQRIIFLTSQKNFKTPLKKSSLDPLALHKYNLIIIYLYLYLQYGFFFKDWQEK